MGVSPDILFGENFDLRFVAATVADDERVSHRQESLVLCVFAATLVTVRVLAHDRPISALRDALASGLLRKLPRACVRFGLRVEHFCGALCAFALDTPTAVARGGDPVVRRLLLAHDVWCEPRELRRPRGLASVSTAMAFGSIARASFTNAMPSPNMWGYCAPNGLWLGVWLPRWRAGGRLIPLTANTAVLRFRFPFVRAPRMQHFEVGPAMLPNSDVPVDDVIWEPLWRSIK